MSFTGNENHDIPLSTAAKWTKNYRNTIPASDARAHLFERDIIEAILAQEDCVGIRIYYALNNNGEKRLIICGVTENEDDIYLGLLAETSLRNPPHCGASNPLNS